MQVGLAHDEFHHSQERKVRFWLRFGRKTKSLVSNRLLGIQVLDKRMETFLQRCVNRDSTGKQIDDHIPNSLLEGGVAAGMITATHEMVHGNRSVGKETRKVSFTGKNETKLYSRIVVVFRVEVVRCNDVMVRLLAAGISAA